uniref:M20/M25/M40 family metallo-hydrolase n=1 Tax=Halomonas sp. TaxID=1486246 RepID=UPI00260A0FB7
LCHDLLCHEQLSQSQPPGAVAYATEAGQFQLASLPTVICGPGSISQAHQPDEYIDISQLEAGSRFMQALGQRLKMA